MLRIRSVFFALLAFGAFVGSSVPASAAVINETSAFGFYYQIEGSLFPTPPPPDGSKSSGGTFAFISADPTNGFPLNTWIKDDFPAQDSSVALTLVNGRSIVYDNNGIETGSFGNFYNTTPGHAVTYAMSNNFNLMYSGFFKITSPVQVSQIIGYFATDGTGSNPFQFNSPQVSFRMNIFGDNGSLLPSVNTFTGNVFSTDSTPGTFTVTPTGVNRVFSSGPPPDPIMRLTFTLNTPITLQPGIYWFSHDAVINPVPEPAAAVLCGTGLVGLVGYVVRKRRKQAQTVA